jgi:hypothetical protein
MADDKLASARTMIGERIAELEARMPRLAPHTISRRMDDIRALAAQHGLAALEGLADYGAHHAMMPGARTAMRCCLDHVREALLADSPSDREAILASLAIRLH